MSLVLFKQRDKENKILTMSFLENLAKLHAELRGLDVNNKRDVYESVTACLGTKNEHIHCSIKEKD